MKMKDFPTQAKSDGQNNMFLNLKDKESVRGVFIGEMFELYKKWVNGKAVDASPSDPEAKIRFKCNFVMADEDGALVTKIWEFPMTVYQMLKDINEEYPLESTKVKITRNGVGTDTTYTIMPLVGPKDQMTEKQIETINKMQLHSFEKKRSVSQTPPPQQHSASDNYEEADVPF